MKNILLFLISAGIVLATALLMINIYNLIIITVQLRINLYSNSIELKLDIKHLLRTL